MGAITLNDYDPEAVKTNPSELCADVYISGNALPQKMTELYAMSGKTVNKEPEIVLQP